MWTPGFEYNDDKEDFYPGSNPNSLYYDLHDYYDYLIRKQENNAHLEDSKTADSSYEYIEKLLNKILDLFKTKRRKIKFFKRGFNTF